MPRVHYTPDTDTDPYYMSAAQEAELMETLAAQADDLRAAVAEAIKDYRRDLGDDVVRDIVNDELRKALT